MFKFRGFSKRQRRRGNNSSVCAVNTWTGLYDMFTPKVNKKGNLELDLLWAEMREFPTEIVNNKELRVLKISTDHIHKLPKMITKLTQLEELFLETSDDGDGLQEVPTFLSELNNLLVLSVRGNSQVKSFIDKFISCLPHQLEQLNMRSCGIKQLSLSVRCNKLRLKTLDLSYNNITSLNFSQWLHVAELKVLNLRSCDLERIPEEVKELRSLRELNLDENSRLQDISILTHKHLCNLKVLSMKSCDLRMMPTKQKARISIGLETLILSNNRNLRSLLSLPFSSLNTLKVLELSNCGLGEIPAELGELEDLECLDLSQNRQLLSFPTLAGNGLNKLKSLNLRGCNIQELSPKLSVMEELEKLDLSYNKNLHSLPANACEGFKKLKELHLMRCPLEQLPAKLKESKHLNIHSYSKITFSASLQSEHQQDNESLTDAVAAVPLVTHWWDHSTTTLQLQEDKQSSQQTHQQGENLSLEVTASDVSTQQLPQQVRQVTHNANHLHAVSLTSRDNSKECDCATRQLKEQVEFMLKESQSKDAKIIELEQQKDKNQQEVDDYVKQKRDMEREIEILKRENDNLQQVIVDLQKDNKTLSHQSESLRLDKESFQMQKEALVLQQTVDNQQTELDIVRQEKDTLQQSLHEQQAQLNKAMQQLQSIENDEHLTHCDADRQHTNLLTEQIRILTNEREALVANINKLSTEYKTLRQQHHDLKYQLEEVQIAFGGTLLQRKHKESTDHFEIQKKLDHLTCTMASLKQPTHEEMLELQSINIQLRSELLQQRFLATQTMMEMQLVRQELTGKTSSQGMQCEKHAESEIHNRVKRLESMLVRLASSDVSMTSTHSNAAQLNYTKDISFCLPVSHPVRYDHVQVIAVEASHEWQQLGRRLTFSSIEVNDIVSQIKYENPRDSDRLSLLIDMWKAKVGRQATLGTLLDACEKVGRRADVECALIKRLPKITELAHHCTSRILTAGVMNIVCSAAVVNAKMSPVGYLASCRACPTLDGQTID